MSVVMGGICFRHDARLCRQVRIQIHQWTAAIDGNIQDIFLRGFVYRNHHIIVLGTISFSHYVNFEFQIYNFNIILENVREMLQNDTLSVKYTGENT